ncbi:hypothetical protein Gogos_020769 [Gossypium gossypioides]|uniref:Uncharacterized protein n=1 Tax=Gossypium gossypioides TaxID=34282 RepID=A0A7J9D1R8_GOSGO|nr:hypothetical protein [Gossypium gossypioides]
MMQFHIYLIDLTKGSRPSRQFWSKLTDL